MNFDFNPEDSLTAGTGQSHPDLTPLIDVVLILLVFFMLTSVSYTMALTVEVPEASTAGTVEEDMLTITIDHTNSLVFNGNTITTEGLETALQQALETGSPEVLIEASKQASVHTMVAVFDILRKLKVTNTGFVVKEKQNEE